MFKKYSDYALRFRDESADKGLVYTFRHGFSAIPAGIGHILDTLLGLNGLILKDKDAHFSGPFGFLLGGIPFLFGALVGFILQGILDAIGFIGHALDYLLAPVVKGLHFICFKLNNAFTKLRERFKRWWNNDEKPKQDVEDRSFYAPLLVYCKLMISVPFFNILHVNLTTRTETLPIYMQGFLGFIAGLLPHLSRYLIHRVVGTFTSCVQYFTDGCCEMINSFYSYICPRSPAASQEAAAGLGAENSQGTKRKVRIQLASDFSNEPPAVREVLEKGYDLFAIMGIKKEEYESKAGYNVNLVNRAYKKLAPNVHPDKRQVSGTKLANGEVINAVQEFQILDAAKKILVDPMLAGSYLKRFNADPTKFSNNPTHFFAASGAASSSQGPGMVLKRKKRER